MTDLDRRLPIIVKACDDKLAFNIKVLNISELTSIGDYFVIASGNSTTQVAAISDAVEEKMDKAGFKLLRKEEREFYKLERLWSDGVELDINLLM